jgi:3-phenylpropionate/cinnamic acid dioxygenase small subunit
MPPSSQEVADRLEINDLLVRYTHAIDSSNWDLLDSVFTPDAQIDYTAAGGAKGDYPVIKEWLAKALGNFSYTMHFIGNTKVEFEAGGQSARSRTYCINPMGFTNADGSSNAFNCYVHYVDRLVRTDAGWRIAERTETDYYMDGPLPTDLQIPE